jgi:eukaryotic-like serine/threonine-protein kinase
MSEPNESLEELLFQAALEKSSPAERAAFLDRVCRDNPELRARLEVLLEGCFRAEGFLADPAAGQTVLLPVNEKPGDRIGRYKLLQKIGEGGCGLVYVAEQEQPVRRRVALKVIKLGMDTHQVIARFEAERQALALMDHPNIAKVLDAGATENGRLFFVMELVKGIPITRYCDENQMNTQGRLNLFIQVCHAIQHAHQKGIIHRDLKPSNVLVANHDGLPVPKVIDFGIAKATTDQRLTDKTLYTAIEQFIGTPAYMSPEQANLSGLDVDTRSDIYSLGVLLYELLTGRTPFDAQELVKNGLDAIRQTIREVEPPRPSKRLSTLQAETLTVTSKQHGTESMQLLKLVRGDLDWIVMKCLEKDRARRYETANGLAADLKRHLNNEPVVARPPTAAYRFQKAWRRNKLAYSAAIAILAALVVGLGSATLMFISERAALNGEHYQRQQAQSAQKVSESERERADAQARKASESQQQSRRLLYAADMNLAQQALKLNNLGRARQLLDRHRPQQGEEDLRGWEWRYLWQLTRSGALVTLTNRPVRGWSVSFSPDGTRLAVGWYDARVELWDVPRRRWVRTLTEGGKEHYTGQVAFSPVRNLLAATSEPKTVRLYDLDSDRESVLWRAPDQGEWDVRNLTFSQDGSKVVIYASSSTEIIIWSGTYTQELGAAVWVVNVASAKIESRHAAAGNGAHGAAQLSPDNQFLYLGHADTPLYPQSITTSRSRYSIQCLDLSTGQQVWQTEHFTNSGLTALAISADGRFLASGSDDPNICIWDAATGRLLRQLQGHTSWVSKLIFTKSGHRLISAASDQTIRCWDTDTWTQTDVLRGHTDEVHGLAVSEEAQLIASADRDGNLMLWKAVSPGVSDGYSLLPEHLRNRSYVLDLGRVCLFAAYSNNPPELFDLSQGVSLGAPLGFGPSTKFWNWPPGWLDHWDGTNQIFIDQWSGMQSIRRGALTLDSGSRPTKVAFNRARQLVAWTEQAATNSAFVASLAIPGRRNELKGEIAGLRYLVFSDDGKYLMAFGPLANSSPVWDKPAACVWNIDTRQRMMTLSEPVQEVAFAAGGRVLVALLSVFGRDHEIRFYDLEHSDRPPRLISGKHSPKGIEVSQDGRFVAVSTDGGTVRLCDALTGELIGDLHAHMNEVEGLAFSKDARRLVSAGSGPEAVKLWDVGMRQELLTLPGTTSLLTTAWWSADEDTIIAGPPWQIWHAPSWEEIAAAEAKEKAEAQRP